VLNSFYQKIKTKILQHKIKSILILMLLLGYYFCLPSTLFNEPYSTVIESKEGNLLGAKIARDGQWRFPASDSIPEKFQKCIVAFEDQHFYKHPGFNPISMWNAFRQNSKANRVVRGGSTLSQQVIRLSRKGKKRTYFEKIIEIVLATRLEWRYSKTEILELYAAHAPFGSNVVGLEMASWRYYGLQTHQLSWAESAALAVLPNAPSLIYPGKNQQRLLEKRNRLLLKLHDNKVLDQLSYEMALEEPLPQKPFDLPQMAPHLLQKISKKQEEQKIKTTVQFSIQERLNQIAKNYYNQYQQNEVYNLAILVVEVETRNIIGYVGNAPTDKNHQKDVDIISAPRSTGSILKPLLYAGMLDDGELLPNTLVPDIPTQISGYSPQNFNLSYDGAVPAKRALSRSLNIPSVLMLQDFGVYRFYEQLQQYGFTTMKKHPNHYGLSLILGGAESNLWDLCKTYAGLTGTLTQYQKSNFQYRKNEFSELNYDKSKQIDFGKLSFQKNVVGAGSIYFTYEAMKEVNRPEGDEAWRFYDSSLPIAWKTGTSFGNRDAWAVGTSSKYVVSVWVGNATGEGRPLLTGVTSAAPILFDVFNLLPRSNWFEKPLNNMLEADVCTKSGFLANEHCPKQKQWIPLSVKQTSLCPYHPLVHLDASQQFRVNSSCENVDQIVAKPWFVLPPVMEWYYKKKNLDYWVLPTFRQDCVGNQNNGMDFIYPKANGKIYLTKNFDSEVQPVILKVAHSQPNVKLYWYIDNSYLGKTEQFHEMPLEPKSGIHYITVVDEQGNEIKRKLEVVREK
jgi:penicillin-binding protein 1C